MMMARMIRVVVVVVVVDPRSGVRADQSAGRSRGSPGRAAGQESFRQRPGTIAMSMFSWAEIQKFEK